jgi:hypothetical protein
MVGRHLHYQIEDQLGDGSVDVVYRLRILGWAAACGSFFLPIISEPHASGFQREARRPRAQRQYLAIHEI